MEIRRVRSEEAHLRRYVESCWFPYHRELSDIVSAHSLLGDLKTEDVVRELQDVLDSPADRLWVALDERPSLTGSGLTAEGPPVGFVKTSLVASPQEFDWPDRLDVEDIWVREEARGSGLADELLGRALQQAREDGCEELTTVVTMENERAVDYFDGLGLEVQGYSMRVPLADIPLESGLYRSNPQDDTSIQLRRLRAEESAIRRFLEECWYPFWRDLGDAVDEQHLDPDLDEEAVVEDFLEAYDVPDRRCWIALDGVEDRTGGLDRIEAVFAGWINAGLEPTDQFLDPPERLFVGNLYVGPDYRGSGLADSLVSRAMQYAREEGCVELSLGVEADNDRAMAYYEKLGFEPNRQRMTAPVESVEL